MTRSVFPSKRQARQALKSLDCACELIDAGLSIDNAFVETKETREPIYSWSDLQWSAEKSRHTIDKNRSGFVFKCEGDMAKTFKDEREAKPAKKLLESCETNSFVNNNQVTRIVVDFCEKYLQMSRLTCEKSCAAQPSVSTGLHFSSKDTEPN